MAYVLVILLFSILGGKIYYLQVYQYEKYQELAEYNRIRPVTTYAPRGQILDRNGTVLATNRSVYTISVIRDEMMDMDHEIDLLADYLAIPPEDIEANLKKYDRGRFLPARVARDVPIEKLSLIEEHNDEMPGVMYSDFPVRLYPAETGANASHILGYLREISREELDKLEKPDYSPGDFIGATGIEKQYESILKGSKGSLFQQVDALGREVGLVKEREPISPVPGRDLHLTIDADLQHYTEYLLEGKTGAAIVMNPNSGEVLAMVSKPDYGLDDFAGFMKEDTWDGYRRDESRPLFNRTVLGLYPPGSAIKLIAAMGALETGIVDPNWTVECTGEYQFGDRVFGCWKPEGHGVVNLSKAIVESCNTYFYELIQRMGLDTWSHFARLFGFGEITGINLPDEHPGIIPTRAFMDKKYGRRKWTGGHLLNIVIGQGDVLVTPIQMVQFISAIANRGLRVEPRLVLENDQSVIEFEQERVDLKPSTWDKSHDMIFSAVNQVHGTAFHSRIVDPEVTFSGKTGTAENPRGDPHAWFVGFARKGEETIAVCVLIEHGGTGGSNAAPVARNIVQHYFGIDHEMTILR